MPKLTEEPVIRHENLCPPLMPMPAEDELLLDVADAVTRGQEVEWGSGARSSPLPRTATRSRTCARSAASSR